MTEYCTHWPAQRRRFGTFTKAADDSVYCRGCNRPVARDVETGRVATPSRGSPAKSLNANSVVGAAKVVADGGWGFVKVAVSLLGVFVIGVAIWGFSRAHSESFKVECAAYQEHEASMSFPDNLLCRTYWQLK